MGEDKATLVGTTEKAPTETEAEIKKGYAAVYGYTDHGPVPPGYGLHKLGEDNYVLTEQGYAIARWDPVYQDWIRTDGKEGWINKHTGEKQEGLPSKAYDDEAKLKDYPLQKYEEVHKSEKK